MSIRLMIICALALLPAVCCDAAEQMQQRMVDVGTHRLHAVVAGEGLPAVVIDGGLGAGADEYRALQERIAAITTVIAYGRAGYAPSEEGPLPRDSGTEMSELKAMLEALDVPGPYVIVGHSIGGLNAQVFADLYPDDTGGMVLLDPPPLEWLLGGGYTELLEMARQATDQWQDAADRYRNSSDARERQEAVFLKMMASEHREMMGISAGLANGIETFGDLPLIVIASGVPNEMFGSEAAGYQEYWIKQSRGLASKSSGGRFILAGGSTHRLHEDAADLVFEAVISVVDRRGEKRRGRAGSFPLARPALARPAPH